MVRTHEDQINKDLIQMADGIDIPCDLEVPKDPPPWLNKDLFHLGQNFFWNNPYPVLVSPPYPPAVLPSLRHKFTGQPPRRKSFPLAQRVFSLLPFDGSFVLIILWIKKWEHWDRNFG